MSVAELEAREAALSGGQSGLWSDALRRLRRNPGAILGFVLVCLFIFVALFAPWLAPDNPRAQNLLLIAKGCCPGSSAHHLLGVDDLGRDELSRLLYGARLSLLIGIVSVSVGLSIGTIIGAISGFFAGWVDTVLMRFVDILLAIPGFLMAIGIVALLGPGLFQVMIAIGVVNIPIFARLLRGSVLAQRENDFVLAARAVGVRRRTILISHVLPNAISPVIVQGTLSLATAIIDAAGLSFLGLGPQDPATPEWGNMLTDTVRYLQTDPMLAIYPGIAIVISVLGFNLIGDGLREALDPKLRGACLMAGAREPLLVVEDLAVRFWTARGIVHAVNGVSFEIAPGETLGIVGESGCGKSVTSLALLGILPRAGRVTAGSATFGGRDLIGLSDEALRQIRGQQIAMIFQDPMTSLNPVLTIGRQLREPLETHLGMNKREAETRAAELLDSVGIPVARNRLKDYPHQFSGGMRQRAMIAMALACEPKLLIADEPTTALDVTIQAQILDLLRELVAERDTALIMITHDLGVVAGICERVEVMYGGTFVESGSADQIFQEPRHPYTLGLLESVPRLDARRQAALNPIAGQPRDMLEAPTYCPFAPRCRFQQPRCTTELPLLEELEPGHEAACFYPIEEGAWRRSRLAGSA